MKENEVRAVLKNIYDEYEHKMQHKSKTATDIIRWTEAQNVLLRIAQELDISLKEELPHD